MKYLELADGIKVPIVSSNRYFDTATSTLNISVDITTDLLNLEDAVVLFSRDRVAKFKIVDEDAMPNNNQDTMIDYSIEGIYEDPTTKSILTLRFSKLFVCSAEQVMNAGAIYESRFSAYMNTVSAEDNKHQQEINDLNASVEETNQKIADSADDEVEEIPVED